MCKAVEYFKQGYNCSQAVFLAYAEDFNIDKEIALKISSSFGGGMGRMREVCGAVTSMFAVAGLKHGFTSPNDDFAKQKHYELIQKLSDKFKKKYGSIICKELLNTDDSTAIPTKRTPKFYENRPCCEFIKTVSELISKL